MSEHPECGAVFNYGGDNYAVTRIEPGHFLCLGTDNRWADAIEYTDVVGEGETATVLYVMTIDAFIEHFVEGEIDEDAPPEASQLPSGSGAPPKPSQLPADTETAEPKGA